MELNAKPDFSIVIPTHNTRDHVLAAISSVCRQQGAALEVIVVDDDSTDDTRTAVRDAFPNVQLIHNPANEGFTASANRGLASANGSVLVLLNSDAEILEGSLDSLAVAFDSTPKLAIAGAELLYPDGSPQWSGGRFPSAAWLFALTSGAAVSLGRLPGYRRVKRPGNGSIGRVDWVTGAALAMRRETWTEFGPLDEGYRFYAQDMDLCRRVAGAGLAVRILRGFRAIHHHGATIGSRPGAAGSAHPDLLWTDLLRFVAVHDGLAAARRCRRLMRAGASLRIATRRFLSTLTAPQRRESSTSETDAYRQAAAALRNLSIEDMIASTRKRL